MQKNELFKFMIERVEATSKEYNYMKPQAFAKWFASLYFPSSQNFFLSDGSRDGKVDCFFETNDRKKVEHHILNSKFTDEYNKIAPVTFYQEISHFYNVFNNKETRDQYLQKAIKTELKSRYKKLFEFYDEGNANLIFITNHFKNEAQLALVKNLKMKIFHLDDILQFIIDDLDNAMPRTKELMLFDIHSVLSPDKNDTEVSTSIVFARLINFIKHMEDDPNDLLFARNVRLNLGNTLVNKSIKETFKSYPKEFAFSNNGITILCEAHTHNPGKKELEIVNPRVVNGSQTLHSVREVPNPSSNARIMLRIIEIPPISDGDLPNQIKKKKSIIDKISFRSNQQNPIKTWNLVANDDFQLELFRYFRKKSFFYERREKEYSSRSRALRSVHIQKGPTIKYMSQIISCYYWKNKKLGPANARNLSRLFDPINYDSIKEANPELAYQLFLLNEISLNYLSDISSSKRKIQKLKGYINQALLSLVIKAMQQANIKFGEPKLTSVLEHHYKDQSHYIAFKKFIALCINFIDDEYKKAAIAFKQKEGYDLTIANYFKTALYMGNLFDKRITFSFKYLCINLFK